MRDRLTEMIKNAVGGCAKHWAEIIADHLLANGVIVPPVKVGQTVYYITGTHVRFIVEATVEEIYFSESDFSFMASTEYSSVALQIHDVYFSREEAEKALEEAKG